MIAKKISCAGPIHASLRLFTFVFGKTILCSVYLSVNSVILSHEIAHKQVLYSSTRVLYMSYSARQLTVVVLCSLLIPVRTNPVDIEKAGV